MNQLKKDEILFFISNMLKTGQKVTDALIYYENEVETSDSIKDIISDVVEDINKGKPLEDVLFEYEIINEFQRNILSSSSDKKLAFERIRRYGRNRDEATIFYRKKLFWFTIISSLVFIALPYLIDFFNSQIEIQAINTMEKKEYNPIIVFIMSYRDYYFFFAGAIVLFASALVAFYIYTYENELELHYRVFKIRALVDSVIYFEVINDLFESGLKSHQVLDLAGRYMYPESSREYFLSIKEKIVNSKLINQELKSLAINDFAIFIITTSQQTGDIVGGFKNGLISIKDYKEEKEQKLRDNIELSVFTFNALLVSLFLFFVLIAHIDITM
jgi:type II secretory pathway component PulF